MPPPSPPPPHFLSRGQPASAPQPSPSFLSREHPTNPAHRPGSSMSISSMLGSDTDRPPRDPGPSLFSRPPASSALFGGAPTPPAPTAISPSTAPARPTSLDYPLFRRSQTPEKSFSKNQPGRVYRSSSGGVLQVPLAEQVKFGGLPRAQHPSQYSEKQSPRISSSAEVPYNESRRLSLNGPIVRPNSQPQHIDPSMRTPGYSPLSRPAQGLSEGPLGTLQRSGSFMGLETQQSRFNALFADRQAEEQAQRERERALARESDLKPPHAQLRFGSHYAERDAPDRLSTAAAWELGRSQPPSPESKRFPVTESSSGFGFGAIQSYTKSLGSQLGASRQPPLSIHARQGQPTPPPTEQPYVSKHQSHPRLFSTTSAPTVGQPPSFSLPASDEQRRKGSDELLQHRSLLGVGIDGKRGGRASPLPQAVQGAQAQIIGPAGESSIKNELGRVFSGIGSGVGGVTATATGSGPTTPMAASPFKRDSVAGRSTNSDATTTDDSKIARPASTMGKRQRKSRDDDSQLEGENAVEPRSGTAARGRRGRHVHHHHHQYVPLFFTFSCSCLC